VEKRLAKLENLVAQLLPGIDIDEVLASPDLAKATLPTGVPTSLEPASTTPRLPDDAPAESSGPVLPEAVPNNADGFNWQEENLSVDGLTDGMAALSVEPTGVGYLGTSACLSTSRPELTIH
jgi:transcriptional regulatory protein GAL4